ncbi:tripartite tricarboxylate transporter substrate-binding protein [Variovorax boronicumulans]|uniref:tripartite tricarboxylate transporter substrate-binding protein n=1 Tax=Variovorax boronicumulans TaxID=436515 RepID=UPI0020D11260|nr:tripartite tricarboxylate transporter substrate-binding protein [Variovorax boronicumulans]
MKTHLLSRLIAVTALFAAAGAATAETYPQRPVTLIVPYAAGGPTDQHLRAVAEEAGKALGQPVVLDNRPGASGTNGAARWCAPRPTATRWPCCRPRCTASPSSTRWPSTPRAASRTW